MKCRFIDITTVFTLNGLNVYAIFEIINTKAFPIILAIGSLCLTIILIVVQLKKNKLINQQLKSELLETKKLEMEISNLQIEHNQQVLEKQQLKLKTK